MIVRDYHGWNINDAIRDVELLIGQIRQQGQHDHVELITGFGRIRSAVFHTLVAHHLEPVYKIGNEGTIKVLIS